MRILTVPEDTEILRSQSLAVKKIDAKLISFIAKLGRTLKSQHNPPAVGLSAIQVGRPVRIFAMLLPSEEAPVVRSLSSPAHSYAVAGGAPGSGPSKKEKPELIFYVNPEITGHPNEVTLGEDLTEIRPGLSRKGLALSQQPFLEGCLSIPHIYGPVKRWSWIKAKATILPEEQMREHSVFSIQYSVFSLDGLAARVFQHEIDHLNGILFTDRTLAEGNQLYRDTGEALEPVSLI